MFIVYYTDRYSAPAEAADNAQSLVVTADHNGPYSVARRMHNAWFRNI
jgi:hypothetical protein